MHPGVFPTGPALETLKTIIAHWGYFALFAFVVLGNIGVPVPENSVLWVSGYFVWKGRLDLSLVLLVAVVAAVAGDNLGYWIGRRYGQVAVARYGSWARLTPVRLDKMRSFVRRYGSFGVFIARFVTGLRFMACPLAGSMGLAPLSFFVANVLGALCYVPVMVGAGYAFGYGFGHSLKRLLRTEDKLEYALIFCALALVLAFLGYRALQRTKRYPADSPES